jgi:hypothetical protein
VRMVNVNVGLVVAFRGMTDLSMSVEVVPDVNTHGAGAAGKRWRRLPHMFWVPERSDEKSHGG